MLLKLTSDVIDVICFVDVRPLRTERSCHRFKCPPFKFVTYQWDLCICYTNPCITLLYKNNSWEHRGSTRPKIRNIEPKSCKGDGWKDTIFKGTTKFWPWSSSSHKKEKTEKRGCRADLPFQRHFFTKFLRITYVDIPCMVTSKQS